MRVTSFVDAAILHVLLFAFMKAFQDRSAPWYLCGLIRKPLQDRRDIVARCRALLPWRDRDGIGPVTCAWLRAVHRSLSCPSLRTGHRANPRRRRLRIRSLIIGPN